MISEYKSTAGRIAEITGGTIYGNPDVEVCNISTDSRESGRDSLFVPFIGEKFDAHLFIEQLANEKRMAAYLSMKDEYMKYAGENNPAAVKCADTLKAYGSIASAHRRNMKAKVIGITGTNGKTTTKEMLWTILKERHQTLKNEKNYNNEIGVPYTLLGLKEDHEFAVIEMGMNHLGEIDILSKMAEPDLSIITNVGQGHLEYLETVENVAYAKSEIMRGMKKNSVIILNADTDYFDILKQTADASGIRTVTFGVNKPAEYMASGYRLSYDSLEFTCIDTKFTVPAYGIHNIYNALAAVVSAHLLGVETVTIKNALAGFRNPDMRSQVINCGYVIINDTYNSNPLSAKYALQSLKEIFPNNRKVVIFSDMKELGGSSGSYHYEIGKQASQYGIDLLLTYGELAEEAANGALSSGFKKDNAIHFDSKNDLIEYALSHLTDNDVILVKGSRSMKMEDVADALIR